MLVCLPLLTIQARVGTVFRLSGGVGYVAKNTLYASVSQRGVFRPQRGVLEIFGGCFLLI